MAFNGSVKVISGLSELQQGSLVTRVKKSLNLNKPITNCLEESCKSCTFQLIASKSIDTALPLCLMNMFIESRTLYCDNLHRFSHLFEIRFGS